MVEPQRAGCAGPTRFLRSQNSTLPCLPVPSRHLTWRPKGRYQAIQFALQEVSQAAEIRAGFGVSNERDRQLARIGKHGERDGDVSTRDGQRNNGDDKMTAQTESGFRSPEVGHEGVDGMLMIDKPLVQARSGEQPEAGSEQRVQGSGWAELGRRRDPGH